MQTVGLVMVPSGDGDAHPSVAVALEALREYLRRRGRSVDALMEADERTRVARVIRPYLEALA